MKNTKFLVKLNRGNTLIPQYVQRMDRTPIQTTTNPKQALVMGRFTAEDAVKSTQSARCIPELVPVKVNACGPLALSNAFGATRAGKESVKR